MGGKIKVPTPSGMIDLKIPAATSSGKKMRLKGRGIPAKQPGDFYVTLMVILPDELTDKEKDLFQELQQISSHFNPRAKLGLGK